MAFGIVDIACVVIALWPAVSSVAYFWDSISSENCCGDIEASTGSGSIGPTNWPVGTGAICPDVAIVSCG